MQMQPAQLEALKKQLKGLKERSPFYAKKFEGIDLDDIQSQADFEKLPFSEKADLRDAYPLGLAAVPEEKIVRIHSSSGTTGTFPTPRRTWKTGLFSSRAATSMQA